MYGFTVQVRGQVVCSDFTIWSQGWKNFKAVVEIERLIHLVSEKTSAIQESDSARTILREAERREDMVQGDLEDTTCSPNFPIGPRGRAESHRWAFRAASVCATLVFFCPGDLNKMPFSGLYAQTRAQETLNQESLEPMKVPAKQM